MSRRPSTLSITSQSVGNGDISQSFIRPRASLSRTDEKHARHDSKTGLQLPADTSSLDPDEPFTKHTIAEVKLVQRRLRADADAKQKELRLMVGERYRDLLQASSSIISMAQSSNRVTEALEEAKDIITAQEKPPLPNHVSTSEENDGDLRTLQLFSVHMKLLLDAPEHLWRLIEKRKYFSAAWLYLLARVVHHALVRDDEQDEEATWCSQGLDVLEQFPLVQRQWDAVSQFRAQVIHKATMSLREFELSAEDASASLLALYFLDSRPLSETLSVFLSQRVKTLHIKLAWASESSTSSPDQLTSDPKINNGHLPDDAGLADNKHSGFRRAPVQEVKQALLAALDVVSRTLKISRDVFQLDPLTRSSMITGALEYIQSDSPNPTASGSLHPELQLTTQKVLATLPSSSHFLLLPPNLRFYKPYVDLTSSSSFVPQTQLSEKLGAWFRESIKNLHTAAERWISNLRSVTEVWNVRSSILKWIKTASGFEEQEALLIKSIFDDLCRERLVGIWRSALADAGKAFSTRLETTISAIASSEDVRLVDTSPVEYLFQVPPLPSLSLTGPVSLFVDSSFQKYKSTLRRQLIGRTLLLDQVLSTLENCARSLQQDLSRVYSEEGGDTGVLSEQFTEAYRPDAEALCLGVLRTLSSNATSLMDDPRGSINGLVFLGGVGGRLSLSSSFVGNINCGEMMANRFRNDTHTLHNQIIDCWQQRTVTKTVREYWDGFHPPSQTFTSLSVASMEPLASTFSSFPRTEPSSHLLHAFLSLSNAIQQLGIHQDPLRRAEIAKQTLSCFVTHLVDDKRWEISGIQALSDLALLEKLASFWGVKLDNVCDLLAGKASQVQGTIQSVTSISHEEYVEKANEYLSRTQTLLATLLPSPSTLQSTSIETSDKSSALLSYGLPDLEQTFQSAVRVAKPTSRFGLLLVGG